jgi:hypothetical protein
VLCLTVVSALVGALFVHAQTAASSPRPAHARQLPRKRTSHAPPPRTGHRDAGELVAHVRVGRVVAVRTAPGGPVVARLSARTEFDSPRTLAVTRELSGRGYRVMTTVLPNRRTGWVDAGSGALRLTRARVSVDVDLSTRLLSVRKGSRVLRRFRVGIGAATSPTPVGRFAITDKLRGSEFSAAYGCCILALTGHQTNLPQGWTGGDRISVHGGSTAGAVSAGCIHASTQDLVYLMRSAPLGALVVIHP